MRINFKLFFIWALLFIVSGSAYSQKKVIFTPQWTAQSQFAGYYAAQELGFYNEAGLDVSIIHPSTSFPAINRLKDGSSHFVTMQLQQAMLEIGKEHKVVNILQTGQNTSLYIMPRHEKISSMEDLRGKKVGIWKVGFGDFALIIDEKKGLNINWIPFLQNINLFISGVIDATLATSYNELLQLRAAGYDISSAISIADEGYDFPEDGLYVSEEFFKKDPKTVKSFAEASKKGWQWVEEHPEEALEIVMKYARQSNIATNQTHQRWMLQEILRLNKNQKVGEATYRLEPEDVTRLSDILLKEGKITEPITYETLTGGNQ